MGSFFVLATMMLILGSSFTLALPAQVDSCLRARYFIVDNTQYTIHRGRLIAFNLPVNTQYFKKGTRWIKRLVGCPGDTIKVTMKGTYVNDAFYENNMNILLMAMKKTDGNEYFRQFKLAKDQYFVIGETPLSYDSRFWGPISEHDMLGDAYALF
jgi:conjugal transfer pilin signal peptidase TrbI